MSTTFLNQFRAARRASAPIIAIKTVDPEATMQGIQSICTYKATDGSEVHVPLVQHDCIRGWAFRNEAGEAAIVHALGKAECELEDTISYAGCLTTAYHLPFERNSPVNPILFVLNAHHYLDKTNFIQALWNLRDEYKSSHRTIVLLGPDFSFPPELEQDIMVLDEPLPGRDELLAIVLDICLGSGVEITEAQSTRAVDALLGLSAFTAETAVAMSLTKAGLDINALWERKRQMISNTHALSVYMGVETMSSVAGYAQVKKFLQGVINGEDPPCVLVFIDEGEKMFAGAASDWVGDNGVNKYILGKTLSFMEDKEADGAIFVGGPGTGKTAIGKTFGNEAGIPTVILDLGAARGGNTSGSAEAAINNAYKVIDAVGGGRVYFIMTCNKLAVLPPELKRRFTSGIFYFEEPDAYSNFQDRTERDAIWAIYTAKYKLDMAQVSQVDDAGWTGAEIRNCCRLAHKQKRTIPEAADFIVPVCKSAPEQIATLRRDASGKFLSANQPGIYQYRAESGASIVAPRNRAVLMEADD